GHLLPPRLCAGCVQELIASALKLVARRCDRVSVLNLELDRSLGNDPVGRPVRRAKAGFRRLREWPYAEVLASADAPAGVVAIALAFQPETEVVHEQLAALRWLGGDDCHAGDEENVHARSSTA